MTQPATGRYTGFMTSFTYIARTSGGTLEKGEISASSPESAREKLRKKQLMVEELREAEGGGPSIGFAGAMPWTTTEDDLPAHTPVGKAASHNEDDPSYIPLTDTLRLFAGWLLAWYALVYLLGSFRASGRMPFDIPFLEALFVSPLVLRFSFATFLFLLLTSVHRRAGRGTGKGIVLAVAGIVIFVLFHLNG